MNFHLPPKKRLDPKLFAGLVLLAIANSAHFLFPRLGFGGMDRFDFVQGLLMGAAIGLLLWSVVGSRRRREPKST